MPPTGEREGARADGWPRCPKCGTECFNPGGLKSLCAQCGYAWLMDLGRGSRISSPATRSIYDSLSPEAMSAVHAEQQTAGPSTTPPAAPAQPGEGEPSADEWAKALEAVLECVNGRDARFTVPLTRARALLERRGGKGLSKGGG